MSETRGEIRAAIAGDPGVHFNALVRETPFAPGQVQYHVRRLIASGDVVRHERFGRTHYFAPEYSEWERDALAVLRRETAAAIATALYSRGTSRPNELVETLGIPRSTLEHHLDHLLECDVVDREYARGNHVVLSLSRPAETAALLETVDPHPGSRLVDRFERLVDSFLEG
ncbi:winged helix-turn-helix transcriptional regulator [Natrialbaceae archaeon A-chndr2]